MKNTACLLAILTCLFSCSQNHSDNKSEKAPVSKDTTVADVVIHDTSFVRLIALDTGFILDIKYATSDNFLGKDVYPCADCLLRNKVAKALIAVNQKLLIRRLRIKIYDCYRPLEVQRKMWNIIPDGRYVADPNKKGSVHNRGAAVDITLTDMSGKNLDMGTGFDHFGKEAHHDFQQLPDTVISNRRFLKTAMESEGFSAINTEWWHYVYGDREDYSLSDVSLCE